MSETRRYYMKCVSPLVTAWCGNSATLGAKAITQNHCASPDDPPF
jgi:hypothetical protein